MCAFLCWASFTPNLPNECGVSALESLFHYDGFEFHCVVVCFVLVQIQTAASCTESLLLPVVYLLQNTLGLMFPISMAANVFLTALISQMTFF